MENLSLFGMNEGAQQQLDLHNTSKLDVVKMEFSGAETLSWQALFSGFDTLHAITYSSGIGFVYRLLDLFEHAEIMFGCDEVISYSFQEVMAYQCKMVERIRETAGKMKLDLVSRIEDGTLRFYVARSVLSHEKIYLLSAKDGRKRVIMGSANCLSPDLAVISGKISAIWMGRTPMIGTGIVTTSCGRTAPTRLQKKLSFVPMMEKIWKSCPLPEPFAPRRRWSYSPLKKQKKKSDLLWTSEAGSKIYPFCPKTG